MPVTKRADYKPSAFLISHTDLAFELDEEKTLLTSTMQMKRTDPDAVTPLVLDGGDFALQSISVNDELLDTAEYEIKDGKLTLLHPLAEAFTIKIVTVINPTTNTKLTGLYKTGELLTTHNEAQGFRNMTYYLDRPDVLSTFTTRITADKKRFPVLLSNGNPDLTERGTDAQNPERHYVTYHNPVPIPSYLYALVAGNLACREDEFVTRSGKKVALRIYVPEVDHGKTEYAMFTLKEAMRFDEEQYDREYDLDTYNIVGVPAFNAGAMENKGLNIFNNTALLADPRISTDAGFEWVYHVVGHEYFHNWRGDRVTVKNWFQLSLKEGFATVTEQEFSQLAQGSRVARIDDIRELQLRQFKQDAGPMAHPVLLDEYETPDNVYTTTIYKKGAELINTLRTLIGKTAFKQGCNIYFAEHDGQAASIEDFIAAMEKASQRDLSQFFMWYTQAGTPQLEFAERYDADQETYTLTVRQSCPPTPGQTDKKPLLVPITTALYGKDGQAMPLQLDTDEKPAGTECLLELHQSEQSFTFVGVKEKPVPSLLRNFSAPVKITRSPVGMTENIFLLEHDTDPVNRWFAGQNLVKEAITKIIVAIQTGARVTVDRQVIAAFRAALLDPTIEPRLKSQLITFPKADAFLDVMKPADTDVIQQARTAFINHLMHDCYDVLQTTYESIQDTDLPVGYTPEAAGLRRLKNACLTLLVQSGCPLAIALCKAQVISAANMTDRRGALEALVTNYHPDRVALVEQEIDRFAAEFRQEPMAMQHFFNLYGLNEAPDAVEQLRDLFNSDWFDKSNPNHTVKSLLLFTISNAVGFHHASGTGYQFIADCIIELDKINPHTASYLAPAFSSWKLLEPGRQARMLEQLFRLDKLPLSTNVKELIGKSVKEAKEMMPAAKVGLFGFFKSADGGEREPGQEESLESTAPRL